MKMGVFKKILFVKFVIILVFQIVLITIRNLIQKFESSVNNVKPSGREKTVRTVENIAAVRESISNELSLSIPVAHNN